MQGAAHRFNFHVVRSVAQRPFAARLTRIVLAKSPLALALIAGKVVVQHVLKKAKYQVVGIRLAFRLYPDIKPDARVILAGELRNRSVASAVDITIAWIERITYCV